MKTLLQKLFDIRQGELSRTALLFSYSFLIIASYYILKPMTRSLFLKNQGPAELPYVYMLVALVVGVVAVFYARFASKLRLQRLINGTTLVIMGILLIFWWLLKIDVKSEGLYYGLYIWTSIYGVLTISQFWLLANYMFNPREAKRLFPILTVGAILGGIMGGYFTGALVKHIGTSNLALISIGFLGLTIILMNLVWRRRNILQESPRRISAQRDEGKSYQIVGEVFNLIRNSRHLALLMGIVAMTVMVSQIADFQFSIYASKEIKETDKLTGFFGLWFSNLSIVSLIFQVLFAGVIIRRFGVGSSILFLPLVMLVTSLWVFLGYGLISILALRIGDGAFRHSINRVGIELLYLPIPPEVKKKTKTFVDMFADRFARGISGFLLLIFYTWLDLSVERISLMAVVLVGLWLLLGLKTHREYINTFRQALAKRRIDADTLTVSIKDEAAINTLISALGSQNERQVVYALELLDSVTGVDLLPPLRPLLKHVSPEVRLRSLQLLEQCHDRELIRDVKSLLHDPDVEVRREAVRYFSRFSSESAEETLRQWLQDENSGLRSAALYCVTEQPELAAKLLYPELIDSFFKGGVEDRAQLADALGVLNDEAYHSFLLELLQDSDDYFRTRAIASAGQTRSRVFVPVLLQHLEVHTFRRAAIEALANYGDGILETLFHYLSNEGIQISVRFGITRVLGLIGSQRNVDMLLDYLNQHNGILRYYIIKALNKLHTQYPDLDFDQRVEKALTQEIRKYYRLFTVLYNADKKDNNYSPCSQLLKRSIRERLDDHFERIFRLLGLRYAPKDIYNAYTATISSNLNVRSNAVEFLDNILPQNLKRLLLPLVDELPVEQMLQQINGLLDVQVSNRKQALQILVSDSDPWLRACSLYEIGVCRFEELRPLVESAINDDDPLVQETAAMVLLQYFKVNIN